MKIHLQKLIPGLLLFPLLSGSAFGQTRIATVSMQRLFNNYWKTKQADVVMLDRQAEMEKSRTEMLKGWKKAKEAYQKMLESANDQAVSSEEREKRKKEAENKLRDIKDTEDNITQFQRQATAALSEQKARMRKNILDEIRLAISSKARTGGYSLVLDSDAQTYIADPLGPYYLAAVLYADSENDVTDAVLKQLNASAPVVTSKPGAKTQTPKDEK